MDAFHAQLPYTLKEADFPALGQLYRGKVRDNYSKGDRIVMITTDRLSAFDRVLTTVPFKGELLNRLTVFWFEKTKDVAPNHILEVPDPSVLVVRRLKPLAVEMVVRGYITGSLWRDHQKGRNDYGIDLPKDLKKDQKFDQPILTPSTKEEVGKHDLPISPAQLVARGTLTQRQWDEIARMALDLFAAGQNLGERARADPRRHQVRVRHRRAGQALVHRRDPHARLEPLLDRRRLGRALPQGRGPEDARQGVLPAVADPRAQLPGRGAAARIPDDVRAQLAGKYAELVQTLTGEAPKLVPGDTRARIEKALKSRNYL